MGIVMCLTMGVTVFAATYSDGDGSITVNNAVKGETYYAIKVLDATVSDDGIAYYADEIPATLADVLEVKTITGSDGETYQALGKADGVSAEDYDAAMRAFADANKSSWGEGIECTGNSVTFEDLELGFYVIVSTLNGEDTNKVSAGSTYAEGAGAAAGKRRRAAAAVRRRRSGPPHRQRPRKTRHRRRRVRHRRLGRAV